MAREEFIDSLRIAYRSLPPPKASSGKGSPADTRLSVMLHNCDFWLTPKSVEGFDPADWPEDRQDLQREVQSFLAIAKVVPADKPATKQQSKEARKHLEAVIRIVGSRLRNEWLKAQEYLIQESTAAATAKGWHVEKDQKQLQESLLGEYLAPRLWIKTRDREVVLDPVARFGSGRQGVVDLAIMPAFETMYLVTFKDDQWNIVSPRGTRHKRPFTQASLVQTIGMLGNN